jgi:hypothetical protein
MARIVSHERPRSVQEQHPFPFLREILLFLSLAGILIPTLQRLRINQVLGFLAVGALFGPFGLGRMAQDRAWGAVPDVHDRARAVGGAAVGHAALGVRGR